MLLEGRVGHVLRCTRPFPLWSLTQEIKSLSITHYLGAVQQRLAFGCFFHASLFSEQHCQWLWSWWWQLSGKLSLRCCGGSYKQDVFWRSWAAASQCGLPPLSPRMPELSILVLSCCFTGKRHVGSFSPTSASSAYCQARAEKEMQEA